jgi:hypothetical protein
MAVMVYVIWPLPNTQKKILLFLSQKRSKVGDFNQFYIVSVYL